MDLNDIQVNSYNIASKSGFYDNIPESAKTDPTFIGSRLMLMVSELAEALEEIRAGINPIVVYHKKENPSKPEGFPIELADLIIRVADTAEWLGIDLSKAISIKEAYNQTRPYKHGKTI